MFDLKEKATIRECKKILSELYNSHKKLYVQLFIQRKRTKIKNVNLTPLLKVGILKKFGEFFIPIVRCFPVKNRFFVTDYFTPRKADNVFPIQIDESAYFAQNLRVKEGDIVLDLFTGSGIYPIFCAEKAKKVYAVDTNEKALNYARFNAILNGVESKISFLKGNMFEPVKSKKFNLITANPPYVPTPPTKRAEALFADSGKDGLKYPKVFLKKVENYLAKGGRIQIYLGVVGNKRNPWIEKYLDEIYRDKKVKIILDFLNNKPIKMETFIKKKFSSPLNFRLNLFSKKDLSDWKLFLKEKDYTHFYYILVSIMPSKRFRISKIKHKKEIRKDLYLTSGGLDTLKNEYIIRLLKEYCG